MAATKVISTYTKEQLKNGGYTDEQLRKALEEHKNLHEGVLSAIKLNGMKKGTFIEKSFHGTKPLDVCQERLLFDKEEVFDVTIIANGFLDQSIQIANRLILRWGFNAIETVVDRPPAVIKSDVLYITHGGGRGIEFGPDMDDFLELTKKMGGYRLILLVQDVPGIAKMSFVPDKAYKGYPIVTFGNFATPPDYKSVIRIKELLKE